MFYILVTCRLLVSLYMIDMYTEVRDIPLVSQLTPSLPLDPNVGVSILTAPRLHGSDNEKSKFAFSSSDDAKSWLGERLNEFTV